LEKDTHRHERPEVATVEGDSVNLSDGHTGHRHRIANPKASDVVELRRDPIAARWAERPKTSRRQFHGEKAERRQAEQYE
jgi:hypothetical protein